jgi:hypothetical protein
MPGAGGRAPRPPGRTPKPDEPEAAGGRLIPIPREFFVGYHHALGGSGKRQFADGSFPAPAAKPSALPLPPGDTRFSIVIGISPSCFFPSLVVSFGSPCFGCGRRPLQAPFRMTWGACGFIKIRVRGRWTVCWPRRPRGYGCHPLALASSRARCLFSESSCRKSG